MFSCWQVLWFTFKSRPWRWRYDRIVSRQRGRTQGHPREREYWPSNNMLQLRHSSCPLLIKHLEAWNIKITLIVGFKPKHYDGVHCQDVGPTFFAVLMPKMSVEQIIIAVEGRWTTTLTVMFRSKTVGQNEKTPNENTQNSLKIFAASGVEEDRWQDLATKRFCIFSAHGQLKPAAEILNSKLRTYFYKHTREFSIFLVQCHLLGWEMSLFIWLHKPRSTMKSELICKT